MRKRRGYIVHANLMTEAGKVESSIDFKTLIINILPKNGNIWHVWEG